MTRAQMIAQVQHWLGLQDIDDYDETAIVNDLLYRGTIDLLARTRCVARCVHLHTQAGVDVYTLDHNILSLVDVEDGATRRARRDQHSWSPTFTLIRSDILRLNPGPSEDGQVDVWAVLLPQQMVNNDDSPGEEAFGAIPEEYQDAIVLYALWQGSDYSDEQSGSQGERYRILYEGQEGRGGRLAQIRSSVNRRGTSRAAPRRVRMRGGLRRSSWVG